MPSYANPYQSNVNGVHINFFVTHLAFESTELRSPQFAEVAKHVNEHTPYIIVGDFNTADFTEFQILEGASMVNNADHSIPTFPGNDSAIDNIVYTTDAWQFSTPTTVANNHSDHYMLYAEGTLTLHDASETEKP